MADGTAASSSTVGHSPLGSPAWSWRFGGPLSVAALVAPALWGLACPFAWRRAAGAVTTPLTGLAYLTIAMLIIFAASAARRIVAGIEPAKGSRLSLLWRREQATLGAAALLLALWMGGTPAWSVAVAFVAIVADRLWNRQPWPIAKAGVHIRERPLGLLADDVVLADKSDWSQQLRRYRSMAGFDVLSVQLRVTTAAGQRHAAVHVAFCPPFTQLPRVEVRALRGPSAQAKVGQLLPHGARLDLKLSEPGPATLVLSLLATAPAQAPQD